MMENIWPSDSLGVYKKPLSSTYNWKTKDSKEKKTMELVVNANLIEAQSSFQYFDSREVSAHFGNLQGTVRVCKNLRTNSLD